MEKDKKLTVQSVITVSCVVVFVLLICALIINLVQLASVNSREKELAAQIAALDTKIEQNSSEIESRATDEYVDKVAREYLNMRGKDEITFIAKKKK